MIDKLLESAERRLHQALDETDEEFKEKIEQFIKEFEEINNLKEITDGK